MAWGSEEEKRKFAIGALFGSEYFGLGTGGATKPSFTLEDLMANGCIMGWEEPLYTTKKTYCSKYYEQTKLSYTYWWIPLVDIEDILYNAITQTKLKFPVRKLSLAPIPGGTDRGLGVGIALGNGVELWIHEIIYDTTHTMDGYATINNFESFYVSLVSGDTIITLSSTSNVKPSITTDPEDSTRKRFEISLTYYDFEENGYLWWDGDNIIFPLTSEIVQVRTRTYYLKDLTQYYTKVESSFISDVTTNPTIIVWTKYMTETALEKITKITKPYIKGITDGNIVYLDTGSLLVRGANDYSAKITLFNDNSKYFYVRYSNTLVMIVDKGTL